jgi:DNA mismatch repair endonuclease MutH
MIFDYRAASRDEIWERAKALEGMRLGELGASFSAIDGTSGKAEVGHAVEAHFGIPRNSLQEADFPGAGIELKVVPMRRTGRGLGIKERTVISMIDYDDLVLETWDSAKVRGKLRILFVFFEHLDGRPKAEFPIRRVVVWTPDVRAEAFLRADWERVQAKVRHGLAHRLSESDGRIMGPCTKGADASHLRTQPFSSEMARYRAFALKPSFTLHLYRDAESRAATSIAPTLEMSRVETFEQQLTARFEPFVGRTVGEVGDELRVPRSMAKSYAAQVSRRIFGAAGSKTPIREFEEMGLTPRVTRVGPDLMPYESLSFPAFAYFVLLEEDWADSDLLSRVEYMLLIPVRGPKKGTPQASCTFGRPVFWRPTADELELIRREWETYRIEIRNGRATDLTPASATVAIHVRPHGRDANDTADAPVVGPVVKKSFWLNRGFVQRILRDAR